MSEINYQALREAAEKATPGRVGDRVDGSIKYECKGYDGTLVLRTDHKNAKYGFVGGNDNADELFFRLCEPDVILALLDALEAREVQLPTGYAPRWGRSISGDKQYVMIPKENGMWLDRFDVEHALRAAGIRIKGE